MTKNKRIDKSIEEKIINQYLLKISVLKIAREYRVTTSSVFNILKRNGINQRNGSVVYPFKNENYLDFIDTQEKAYLLGLITADGCVRNGKTQIVIALQEEDKDILEKYSKIILGENSVKIKQARGQRRKKMAWFYFSSKRLVDRITALGINSNKSFDCDPKIENFNKDLFKAYLLGLNDGDGAIYMNKTRKTRSVIFALICSIKLCEKLHSKIKEFLGINLHIYPKKVRGGELRYLRLQKRDLCLKLLDWLYSCDVDCLKRKKNVYLKFKNDCRNYRRNRNFISNYPYITLDSRYCRPRWKAVARLNGGKPIYVGQFDTEEEAYKAQQQYIKNFNICKQQQNK